MYQFQSGGGNQIRGVCHLNDNFQVPTTESLKEPQEQSFSDMLSESKLLSHQEQCLVYNGLIS